MDTLKPPRSIYCRGHGQTPWRSNVPEVTAGPCIPVDYATRRPPLRDVTMRLARDMEIPDGPDGCWVWVGHVQTSGYGTLKIKKKDRLAHRLAYERWVGPIPDGLVIDHLCMNRRCIRPAHLEAVTSAENTRRAALSRLMCGNGLHPKRGLGPCPDCARDTATRRLRRSRKLPLPIGPGSMHVAVCRQCGKDTVTYRPDIFKWCGRSCRDSAYRQQHV